MDNTPALKLAPDEKDLPLTIQKRLSGMRTRIAGFRRAMAALTGPRSRYKQERALYDLYIKTDRTMRKLERATWTAVFDSDKVPVAKIREYLAKVRKGLGFDE